MSDTQRTLHQAYSELAFDSPYIPAREYYGVERNTARDTGMALLRHAWFHLFGTAIPKPIDS